MFSLSSIIVTPIMGVLRKHFSLSQGASTIINLAGSKPVKIYGKHRTDATALAEDWYVVGQDFHSAINQIGAQLPAAAINDYLREKEEKRQRQSRKVVRPKGAYQPAVTTAPSFRVAR